MTPGFNFMGEYKLEVAEVIWMGGKAKFYWTSL